MTTSPPSPSSPLLGTAYLTSLSLPSPSPPSYAPSILCQNLTLFKSVLLSSRAAIDDAVIVRLNRSEALSRRGGQGKKAQEACEGFWTELREGWDKREGVLRGCVEWEKNQGGGKGGGGEGEETETEKEKGGPVEMRLSLDREEKGKGKSSRQVVEGQKLTGRAESQSETVVSPPSSFDLQLPYSAKLVLTPHEPTLASPNLQRAPRSVLRIPLPSLPLPS